MQPHPLYRSEAFAEDLPGFAGEVPATPRHDDPHGRPLSSRTATGQLLWPLALACTAATLLTVLAPVA